MADVVIGLVGNPNCGKTTVFNVLTGSRQRVGNWSGVTVERKSGTSRHGGVDIEVVDLPGVYSLEITAEGGSVDEQVAREYVLSGEADLIVNVVDAANLERNLYLTTQLMEMGVPLVVALNMMDAAAARGLTIDVEGLQARLGCPVVPVVASRRVGIDALKGSMVASARAGGDAVRRVVYPEPVEAAVEELAGALGAGQSAVAVPPRWLAVKLLEGDELAGRLAGAEAGALASRHRERIEALLGEDMDIIVADSRYGFIRELIRDRVTRADRVRRPVSDRIDQVVLNRWLGIPIFLGLMYLMFLFTVNLGGAFVDFFDRFTGTVFVDGLAAVLGAAGLPDWLVVLLADGLGGGIQTVSTFIPIVGFLYLFLSFLEDSGYMARGAFIMDRLMRAIGLPGKSFVPMIVGFGCNVPAIMASRTLENPRDRMLTVAMTPFMSCGARLAVYALFAAAFFPVGGQNLVFLLYLVGIAMAVVTGLILKHTLLRGDATPFVMELPPYRLPLLRSILLHTWERLRNFITGAGLLIVPLVLVLNFFHSLGTDGSFGNQGRENSVLSVVGRSVTPVFAPMGIREDNWPATVGILTGVLAKEAVVGTLDSLYGTAEAGAGSGTQAGFWAGIGAAFASIPANLGQLGEALLDPLGVGAATGGDGQTVAGQAVGAGTFGAMVARFDGQVGAFAYMLLILLYFPCAATLGAIYRETSLRWSLFVAGWTSAVGYLTAVLFYQLGTLLRHPAASLGWLVFVAFFALVSVLLLRLVSVRAAVARPAALEEG